MLAPLPVVETTAADTQSPTQQLYRESLLLLSYKLVSQRIFFMMKAAGLFQTLTLQLQTQVLLPQSLEVFFTHHLATTVLSHFHLSSQFQKFSIYSFKCQGEQETISGYANKVLTQKHGSQKEIAKKL